MGCRGISPLAPVAIPSLLLHWPWGLQGFFSHIFLTPLSQLLHSIFYAFLNTLSQRHHQRHWWAQLWPVVGLFWRWLEMALSHMGTAPDLLSQKPPLKPTLLWRGPSKAYRSASTKKTLSLDSLCQWKSPNVGCSFELLLGSLLHNVLQL